MRKRTFNHIIDKVFWSILYMLPLIVFVICLFLNVNTTGESEFNLYTNIDSERVFSQVWESFFIIEPDNIVSQALNDISAYFRMDYLLGSHSFLNNFFTYYIYVVIFHILVDVLLFIPKLAHKWIGGFINEE